MAQIKITDLTFSYEGSSDTIFNEVNLILDTDWKLGFTGRNGRGKTTFLSLLMGMYEYRGKISSPVKFSLFPPKIDDMDELNYNIVMGMNDELKDWRLRREMNLIELDEDVLWRSCREISEGERTKLLIAAMFAAENDFLLIDEPTNHLDLHGREVMAEYLSKKHGFILVSHDRAFLDKCVDHVLSINKTNIEIMQGNFTDWMREKDRRDREELSENEKLKHEIVRLKETAREKADWSDRVEATKIGNGACDRGYVGHKAAKMMARSKAIEKRQYAAIEEKTKLLKNLEESDSLKLHTLDYHSDTLAYLKNITIAYTDISVCENVTFEIKKGDRISMRGHNGSGKSSIIKLLLGENIPHTGEFKLGSGVITSYVAQDFTNLNGSLADYIDRYSVDESLFKAILRKMDFSRTQFDVKLENMSMGQKKKIMLARSLTESAHLFVWDEPLNYVDVLSRIQLEELILEFEPTILFVEHDRGFTEKTATKTIDL